MKMSIGKQFYRRIAVVAIATFCLLSAAPARATDPQARYTFTMLPAYIIPSGESPERGSVSPDGRHLAVWMSVGERGYIWFDGERSRLWDAVLLPKFSPDSRHVAYIALEETSGDNYWSYVVYDTTVFGPFNYLAFDKFGTDELVFSPDSLHFAFRVWENGKAFVYTDGKRSGPYQNVTGIPPLFSPDGKRLAYFISDSTGSRVMIDGHPGMTYSQIVDLAGFSDNSKSFSYLGISADSLFRVVKDAVEFEPFRRLSVAGYRPSTTELWYAAARDTSGLDSLYVDGKPIAGFRRIVELAFSEDGKRCGYIAENNGQSVVTIDSTRYKLQGQGTQLAFSRDGKHFSFASSAQKDSITVIDTIFIDGRSFGPFARVSPVVYSPNGSHWLFSVVDSLGKYFVYRDTTRLGVFDSAAVVGWSSDSRQFAFTTMDSGRAHMYLDGQPQAAFKHVMRQVWYDTAVGSAAYIADPEAKGVSLMVNDSSLALLDFFYGAAESFTVDGTLRGYAQRGDTIMQFVIRRESK